MYLITELQKYLRKNLTKLKLAIDKLIIAGYFNIPFSVVNKTSIC